jgi:hypothetical protein
MTRTIPASDMRRLLAKAKPAERPLRMVNVNASSFPEKMPAQTDAERRLANWRNEKKEAAE